MVAVAQPDIEAGAYSSHPSLKSTQSTFDHDDEKHAAFTKVVEATQNGPQLERNFSVWSCLGLAFAILNSWNAMSASLSLVLPSGGSIAMVWGLIVSAIGSMVMCLSLAEICHNLPTTGGQYDWTYVLAPAGMKNSLSFFVGWMSNAGWVSLSATASSLGSAFVIGAISLWNENFASKPWQVFLVYLSFTVWATLINIFGVRLLPFLDSTGGIWGLVGIVVVTITLLACSSGNYQPASEVFARWTNETGWPDGMAFILGLLQSTFGLTAFDSVSHMIEEMPKPAINAPKTMVAAVALGSSTSWIFTIVLLFCLRNYDTVFTASSGPLLQIYYQATNSKAGATVLLIFNLAAMAFAGQGITTVASRMVLTFMRDRGLGVLSSSLSPVHPTLKVPVRCVVFVSAWVTVFGLVNLGSPVAMNAILSASVVFLQMSYVVPIGLLFIRGEGAFGEANRGARWSLGKWRRPINGAALIFASVTTVCFLFPPFIPVTSGSAMNWVIVVFGIVMLMCGLTWVIDGRKNFTGPSELEGRLAVGKAV